MDLKQKLEEEWAQLETLRDELGVKLSLAKADAKDEISALQTKLDEARSKLKNQLENLADSSRETTEEVTTNLVSELKSGYAKLRGLLP
ncbi:MAG TPA: hypothetical protein VIW29_08755 [Polyangiaceae bacterium]